MPYSKNPTRTCSNCNTIFHCKNNSKLCDDCRKTIKRICPICGTEYEWRRSLKSKGIACSPICAAKIRWKDAEEKRGERRPKCSYCGNNITRKYWEYSRHREHYFCSISCNGKWRSENIRGVFHPRYKSGYPLNKYGSSWHSARKNTRLRDVVCQHCGKTREQNKKNLDVHHIIPFRVFGIERHEEANQLSNLITLCPTCHKKAEKQIKY